jgi:hypothetical protein
VPRVAGRQNPEAHQPAQGGGNLIIGAAAGFCATAVHLHGRVTCHRATRGVRENRSLAP